jgi:invasion protein IalB
MRRSLISSAVSLAALFLSGLSFFVNAQTAAPERVETTTYGGWAVSCDEILKANPKKTCSAALRVNARNGQPLFIWMIGLDKDKKLASVIRIPAGMALKNSKTGAISVGLLVSKGVDLKLNNNVHHLDYSTCAPQWCEAFAPMDESFVQDAQTAADAGVTLYAASGAAVNYSALAIKGIEKVFTYVRR